MEWLEPRRLLAAGDLDTSFGTGGLVTTDLSGMESSDEAMAVVSTGTDGEIVVAGTSNGGIALVRYLADGSLDSAFGNGGKVTVALPGGSVDIRAATVQSDGCLLVAGYYDPSGSTPSDFLVARFTAAGALDPTFDGDGWATTDFGSTGDGAWGVAVDSAGRIVVAGFAYTTYYSASNFAVARYLSDGSLDPSFSGDGKLTTDFAGGADFGMSVLIDAAGRIVVGGETNPVGTDAGDLAVARYQSDGILDTAFGTGGTATVDFGRSTEHGGRVRLNADGTLIVAGYSTQTGTGSDFALARFTSGGMLDQTFGVNGRVITDVGGDGDDLEAIKVDADASIHDANRANNVAASDVAVPITLIQSDLQPTVDVAPLTGRAGQTIQVAWTVHNQGVSPMAVGAWEDAWYLSHDDTFQSGVDSWLKSVSYTGGVLESGASYQRTTGLSLPRATEGSYYLFLVTDEGNDLYEHQGEGNNVVGAAQPLVIQDPAADLEVLDFTIAAGPYIAGRAVMLTWHVQNSGTEAVAEAWQDALYWSADAVFDAAQDRRISTFP